MTTKRNKASAKAEAMNKFDNANYTNTDELVSSILKESHSELVKKNKEYQKVVDVVSRDEFKDQNVFEIAKQKIADMLNVPLKDVVAIWQSFRGEDKKQKQDRPKHPFMVDVEPCSESVSPYEVAEELREVLKKHIVFQEYEIRDAEVITCVLWAMASWSVDEFNYSPYLMITAPEKRCGKSQLLGLLANLSKRPLEAGNLTSSVLFRVVEKYHPTVFIDEVDSFLKADENLQGIIKCGIERKKAQAWRLEKVSNGQFEAKDYDTFAFKAFSGINAQHISDTITDRCVTITLKRKLKEETLIKVRDHPSEYWLKLNSKCARVATDYKKWISTHKPENPLDNRDADKWEAMFTMADLIDYVEAKENRQSPQYGKNVRRIAELLSKNKTDLASINVELLSNIRELFKDFLRVNEKFIPTRELLSGLKENEEWRWKQYDGGKGLNEHVLAKKLNPFGIKPHQSPTETSERERPRGYDKKDFEDAFIRYLEDEEPSLEL